MDPEMTVLSEGRWEKQKSYNFYVKAKKKYDTNKLIYKIEMDSQTQRTDLRLPKGNDQEER